MSDLMATILAKDKETLTCSQIESIEKLLDEVLYFIQFFFKESRRKFFYNFRNNGNALFKINCDKYSYDTNVL